MLAFGFLSSRSRVRLRDRKEKIRYRKRALDAGLVFLKRNIMRVLLLIHGPNLNRLGKRDAEHYGSATLADIEALVRIEAEKLGYEVKAFQSNHEGSLIDFLQAESGHASGIIINPGALTHYSYALHDALKDTGLPAVEVHLSDIKARESWRQVSVTAPACIAQISGKKERGYVEALSILHRHISTP